MAKSVIGRRKTTKKFFSVTAPYLCFLSALALTLWTAKDNISDLEVHPYEENSCAHKTNTNKI